MTDDLVKRLRSNADLQMEWHYWEMVGEAPSPLLNRVVAALQKEAADRIEALERLIEKLRAELELVNK